MAVNVNNIIIYTGTNFEQSFFLENNDSLSPLDLTYYDGCAKIKQNESSLTAISFNVTFPDRLNGQVTIALTANQTNDLKPGTYVYDFIVRDSISQKLTKISQGKVFVKKSVTRI
jgi:hypothetical protein